MGENSTRNLALTLAILLFAMLLAWFTQVEEMQFLFPLAFIALGALRSYSSIKEMSYFLGIVHHFIAYASYLPIWVLALFGVLENRWIIS